MTMDNTPHIVLITRPEPDAAETALHLKKRGFKSLVSPVLSVSPQTFVPPDWQTVSGIIISSANALPSVLRAGIPQNIPLFVVGARSHQQLKEKGFTKLYGPVLQSSELPALVESFFTGQAGTLVHLTAAHGEKEFYAALREKGFSVESVHVYRTEVAAQLTDESVRAIQGELIAGALFFSPRSAALFSHLLSQHGLAQKMAQIAAFCLSPAVADVCQNAGFGSVFVAEIPTQESLLDCLAKHVQPRHSKP